MKHTSIEMLTELADLLVSFRGSLTGLNIEKHTLIIHAGTPKTGTTSLQTYLSKKQRKLRGKGILYPHNLDRIPNPHAPAHQWFEKNLASNHLPHFLANFKNIISQIKPDTHTIILSSEGIYNYWWDLPASAHTILTELNQLFDIKIWVWFREPLGFIESYYKQCIRNPQVEGNPCYGKDLSFAKMLEIEWFAQHLNYQGFVADCQDLFGKTKVSVFEYEGDVVQQVSQKLGLATAHDNPTPRQNASLNNVSISLIKVLNQFNLSAKDKELVMPQLKQINALVSQYANETLIDESSRKRVLALAKPVEFSGA
ncbi:hypothetical protein [Flavobacterium sp. W21_SRS_FM6]|uniref:hypothetical protein n=1 Tax=Flavobacterium sp. W21_SRS_FM6 TaxID=3240268 RepID=UPI003F90DF59